MASKYHLKDNSFYYKNTDIPKNKFDIKNSDTIHQIEKDLIIEAYTIFINELKEDTLFDEEYFISLHKKIFDELKNDNYLRDYKNKSKEEFAGKLAYYKCELNALHPFYELNGRITRMFFDMIAIYNGYEPIDYSSKDEHKYIEAAIECVIYADSSKFEEFIYNGLKKS